MGKTLVQTNLMPTIIGIELPENISLRERVVIVPFPYSFVDDETMIASNPNKFKKRDNKVKDMLEKEEYKIAFITMLLNEYKNYLNDGLTPPKAVVDEKEKYFGGADKVKQWVTNNLIEEEPNPNGEYTKKMDMRDQLYTSFQADGGGISYAKFKAGIERLCGKRQTKTGKGMFANAGYYYLQGYRWANEEVKPADEQFN
jgi:phage/plasmid-associated DNA primase